MKPLETLKASKKKYFALMIACFIYGGFSLISFLFQIYSFFWLSSSTNGDLPKPGMGRIMRDPLMFLNSPQNISYLIGGLIAILAGLAIWHLTRQKELKAVRQETTAKLLLPDEKRIIETLKTFDFELTQAKLTKETGLNKVQVHRAIKNLEAKGALEKHSYGLTNKIILKKEFFE